MLKSRKSFFFFTLKFVFCNYKYIFLMKNDFIKKNKSLYNENIKHIFVKSTDLFFLFHKDAILKFLKFNFYLYYFKNYEHFFNVKEILLSNIFCVSYSGYFLNNNYIKNLHNYYLYFLNNFIIYIYSIYKPSKVMLTMVCIYYYKLLKLLITLQNNNNIIL